MKNKRMPTEQRKQLVRDYNNGNGPSNMELAKMHGVTNTCIRDILIKEGVYKPKRKAIKIDRYPTLFEIKTMREQNKVMRIALKDIMNWEIPDSVGDSFNEQKNYIINQSASTLGQVIRKERACALGLISVVKKAV